MRPINLNLLICFSFLIGTFNMYLPIEILKEVRNFEKYQWQVREGFRVKYFVYFFSSGGKEFFFCYCFFVKGNSDYS